MRVHTGEHSVFEIVNMVAGLLLWAFHLLVIYATHAVVCARGWQDVEALGLGVVPLAILLATVVALIGCAWVLINALRDLRQLHAGNDADQPDLFLAYTTATIASFAILAIVWAAMPALFIPACA